MVVLRYGNNSSVQLEFAEGAALASSGVPRGQPLADLGAATAAALSDPIDYPPLAQCTTPGDRVVVALDRGMPQVAEVTAAVVDALVDAGVDRRRNHRARNHDRPRRGARRSLPAACGRVCANGSRLATHDPADRRQLPIWRPTRRARRF